MYPLVPRLSMEIMYITLVKKTIPLKKAVYRGFYLPCFASKGILYVRLNTSILCQITPITKVLRYLSLSEKGLPKSNEPHFPLFFEGHLKLLLPHLRQTHDWRIYSRLKFSSIHSLVSKRASKNCTRCTSFASARAPH